MVPAAHEPLTLGGVRAHWVRARLLPSGPDRPGYRSSPQLRRVAASSVGVSVVAEHSQPIEAEVIQLDAFSAHADRAGLIAWLRGAEKPPRQVFVNHGEAVPADTLRRSVQDELGLPAHVPEYRESIELG